MSVHAQVEASIKILKTIPGVPLLRLAQIEGHIERLEKETAELGWFFSCVSKLVREQTDGEDL